MKKINFIDALFSNEGHYINDILLYKYLSSDFKLHYFVNGNISKENRKKLAGFTLHEYQFNPTIFGIIKFLFKVKKSISKDDFNFVMSVKYISLFIFSVTSRFYGYFLLIHFMPTVNIIVNRFVINSISRKCCGLMALDVFVKTSIDNQINNSNVVIIHSRDLEKCVPRAEVVDDIQVSFIGAMNVYKDISLLIELLTENNYKNIRFSFYSKGIECYLDDAVFKSVVNIEDKYLSECEFDKYLKESDFLFLSYKKEYGIRFSGMVFDAINNDCQIICNDNPSFNYYINNYRVGRVFNTKEELHSIILALEKSNISESIYDDYSKAKRQSLFLESVNTHFSKN